MVVRRRKKVRKLRGSRTHSWGQVGQHRKSGSRGGVGAVGFQKHKWTWTVKYFPDWYGKHGFTRAPPITVSLRTINVGELNELIRDLDMRGELKSSGGLYSIDLSTLGYNRLLGRGKISTRVKVVVASASRKAVEKIRGVGGEVILAGNERRSK